MKIKLVLKTKVVGYSQLFGIDYHRLKARSKQPTTGVHTNTIDSIIKEKGEYYSEYRLVKEKKGFIWWEVLADHGINGYHKTAKQAIVKSLYHTDIFLDEPFEHAVTADFKKIEKYHKNRELGCKHLNTREVHSQMTWCDDCGNIIDRLETHNS